MTNFAHSKIAESDRLAQHDKHNTSSRVEV